MTSSIAALVRIWKIRHSIPGCSFVWTLWVVYFSLKHSCLYNEGCCIVLSARQVICCEQSCKYRILRNDAVIWLLPAQIPVQTSITSAAARKLNSSSISEVVWQIWSRACVQFKIWTRKTPYPVVFPGFSVQSRCFGSQFDFLWSLYGIWWSFVGL